jgi:hypothetical protein
MNTERTFNFLLGVWEVNRTIEDHSLGVPGSFQGTATFQKVPPVDKLVSHRALFVETGMLNFGHYQNSASRHLELRESHGSTVALFFSDGRHFVDIDLTAGRWESSHLCGDDRYTISTVAISRNSFQECWKVRGPRKSYDAVTTLTRLDRRFPEIQEDSFRRGSGLLQKSTNARVDRGGDIGSQSVHPR